ncbi:MAG: hypothetical protein GQ538_07020 [Xanthomonadales bacterium]|nr:hypothetical protein [Xanthomonadales bacterium]
MQAIKVAINAALLSTLYILTMFISISTHASEPAQVMLIGTFHFKDPGLDIAKVADINIFTEESQQYLLEFASRLAEFQPTRVLLEYSPDSEALLNQRYDEYLSNSYELGANEIYQLGFRIAKMAGLDGVQSFDHRQVEWQAEAMFEYAKQHNSPEMVTFNEIIEEHSQDEAQARANLGLRELLKRSNDPERDRLNMDLYMATNPIGAGDGYSGADASASWWHRNFRMYANIQKLAEPGERIIAIGGSGHMAIIKQLLEIDQRLTSVDVEAYF